MKPGAEASSANAASDDRLRALIEALPAAVYTTDADGLITMFNQAAVDLAGRVPRIGKDRWCVYARLYSRDGTPLPHDQWPMAVALRRGLPVRGEELIAERPDGSRITFIPFPTPLRDASGKLLGGVDMLVDISERKEAELAKARLAATSSAPMMPSLARISTASSRAGTQPRSGSSVMRHRKRSAGRSP